MVRHTCNLVKNLLSHVVVFQGFQAEDDECIKSHTNGKVNFSRDLRIKLFHFKGLERSFSFTLCIPARESTTYRPIGMKKKYIFFFLSRF